MFKLKPTELNEQYYLANAETIQSEKEEYDLLKKQSFFTDNAKMIAEIDNFEDVSEDQKIGLKILAYKIYNAPIVNGVLTVTVNKKLDLKLVQEKGGLKGYNLISYPKFTGFKLNVTEADASGQQIKFTLMFFRSGKINCIGLQKDTPNYLDSLKKIILKIHEDLIGPDAPLAIDLKKISNKVLSVKIPKLINLNYLHYFNKLKNWKNIKYNSQLFPGVIVKCENLRVKINFFASGSSIYTGVSTLDIRSATIFSFLNLLAEYLALINKELLFQ